ncbi:hypothetical protein BVC80_1147g5 [Macleaya cordata]|uniref:Uncharacterized protein n=1 Tax=Macleaya cordata TaxID=56857 RepID=A0A200QWG6_MACCD|nr:hypothetical protein BVC80_1147g5 [Macleaya cordata]
MLEIEKLKKRKVIRACNLERKRRIHLQIDSSQFNAPEILRLLSKVTPPDILHKNKGDSAKTFATQGTRRALDLL